VAAGRRVHPALLSAHHDVPAFEVGYESAMNAGGNDLFPVNPAGAASAEARLRWEGARMPCFARPTCSCHGSRAAAGAAVEPLPASLPLSFARASHSSLFHRKQRARRGRPVRPAREGGTQPDHQAVSRGSRRGRRGGVPREPVGQFPRLDGIAAVEARTPTTVFPEETNITLAAEMASVSSTSHRREQLASASGSDSPLPRLRVASLMAVLLIFSPS
jgi:hypothetical protein